MKLTWSLFVLLFLAASCTESDKVNLESVHPLDIQIQNSLDSFPTYFSNPVAQGQVLDEVVPIIDSMMASGVPSGLDMELFKIQEQDVSGSYICQFVRYSDFEGGPFDHVELELIAMLDEDQVLGLKRGTKYIIHKGVFSKMEEGESGFLKTIPYYGAEPEFSVEMMTSDESKYGMIVGRYFGSIDSLSRKKHRFEK